MATRPDEADHWRNILSPETIMSIYPVICPTCFEEFMVPVPAPEETPCEVDYDCEVCCRPMMIYFEADEDNEVGAFARGLNE